MKTKARIGDTYGRLTIQEILPERSGESVVVLCTCSCGNIITRSIRNLRSGMTKSCGCLRKETMKQIHSLPKGTAARNELYAKYKRSALERGIEFHLTIQEFEKLSSDNCHYCGQKPINNWQPGRYNGDYYWNGVDRKDSNLHYTIDNTVSCCSICNRAKGTVPYLDFLSWINRIKSVGPNMKSLTEI